MSLREIAGTDKKVNKATLKKASTTINYNDSVNDEYDSIYKELYTGSHFK
jgi:hypothetical protein